MMSRMMNTNAAMAAPANDVDFSFGAMQAQQPYVVGFDAAAGAMVMPSGERPLLQHHSNLYDSGFDLSAAAAAAGGFPFQEPMTSLPPPHPSMAMAAMPQLPLLTTTSLQVMPTAAEMYHPFGGAGGVAAFLKREDDGGGALMMDAGGGGGGTIGLNLGRRTYFSPADVLAVDRLLTRSARLGGGVGMGMGVLGLGLGAAHHHHHHQPPRCQAEGCKADLSAAKHYHRRHKVCEFHAKAASVVAAGGKQQRFCQQCSRFHVLAEFDEAKRSCRKRLTEHNRRRRKPAGAQGKEDSSPPPKRADTTCITTSCNSDHRKSPAAAANKKSTATISPNGSGVSCLDAMDNNNGQPSSAAAPTALSLAALPLHDDDKDDDDGDGGLDSMLMRQQQQQEGQHDGSGGHGGHGGGGGGNILSCSSVSDQQNGGCNGFFEVDFI